MTHSEQQAHEAAELPSPQLPPRETAEVEEDLPAANLPAESSGGSSQTQPGSPFVVEAYCYERLLGDSVRCLLCPRKCTVANGGRGYCRVRENRGGRLYTLVHSRACSAYADPVEKKPLFHYLPGSLAFSIATAGCNVHCRFCQNWRISQASPEQVAAEYLAPARVVELARRNRCLSIAFTYSEPTVFSEYVMDTAEAARRAGLRTIAVTNGCMTKEAVRTVYAHVDAIKVDLKAFSERFYRKVVGGWLKPVLDTLVTIRSMNKWLEVVYLMVPGLNDSDEEIRDLVKWIRTYLGADVPLHFTQFHPDYLLKELPLTPIANLERARATAIAEGLRYVYIGNVSPHPGEHTFCPRCTRRVIERCGMMTIRNLVRDGACPFCSQTIPGVWAT